VTLASVMVSRDERVLDDVLELASGVRVYNALVNVGLCLAQDIAVTPDRYLLRIRNFGKVSLRTLRAVVPYRADPDAWAVVQAWLTHYQQLSFPEQYTARRARMEQALVASTVGLPGGGVALPE